MKFALAILCSLMLVWGQALAASAPAVNHASIHHCGCGGKMACCQAASTSHSAPIDATPSGASQQILSLVPVTVIWFLTATATPPVSPAVSASLKADAPPIFARNCVRLI